MIGWAAAVLFSPACGAESPLNFLRQGNPFDDGYGAGAWVSGDFGRARLVSCLSGVRDEALATLGVQVQPADGWRAVRITSGREAAALHPLIQMNADEAYYPILMPVPDNRAPMEASARVVLERAGQLREISVALTLPETHHYATAYCAPLMAHMQYVPLPADKADVRARMRPAESGVQLLLTFPQKTRVRDIRLGDEPVRLLSRQQTPRQMLATLAVAPADMETQPLHVYTTRGIFDVRPVVSESPLIVSQPVSIPRALLGGLLLLLMSPYFLMILMSAADKNLVPKIRASIRFLIPVCAAGIVGFAATSRVFDPIQLLPGIWIPIALAGLALLIRPRFVWGAALAAFVVAPKPYLAFVAAADTALWERLILGAFWGLCLLLPLWGVRTYARPLARRIKKIQKANPMSWRALASLPAALLLGWMVVAAAARQAVYRAESPAEAVIVSVDARLCLSCVLPRLFRPAAHFAQAHVLQDSAEGRRLSAQFGQRAPFHIVRTPGREAVLPAGSSRLDWIRALRD